jgi:uncharacterized protein YbjQ (UPF0145 family)
MYRLVLTNHGNAAMKRASLLLAISLLAFVPFGASAGDDHLKLPLQDAMNTPAAKEKLTGKVLFFFGDQKHPAVASELGTFQANTKTNAFGKDEKKACEWAFLSAMLKLQARAEKLGANAVIDIESNYKKNPFSSATQYECGHGFLMAGVTLKGKVVKLK